MAAVWSDQVEYNYIARLTLLGKLGVETGVSFHLWNTSRSACMLAGTLFSAI